ncbi:TPA: hypothetical protein K4452_003047, partial [Enterococcus faecalis]|nr:hypothetical protein [Enterococcus faecalis]
MNNHFYIAVLLVQRFLQLNKNESSFFNGIKLFGGKNVFRDSREKQLKFAIKKKKGGGGAASFVIGCVIFGLSISFGGISVHAADNISADEQQNISALKEASELSRNETSSIPSNISTVQKGSITNLGTDSSLIHTENSNKDLDSSGLGQESSGLKKNMEQSDLSDKEHRVNENTQNTISRSSESSTSDDVNVINKDSSFNIVNSSNEDLDSSGVNQESSGLKKNMEQSDLSNKEHRVNENIQDNISRSSESSASDDVNMINKDSSFNIVNNSEIKENKEIVSELSNSNQKNNQLKITEKEISVKSSSTRKTRDIDSNQTVVLPEQFHEHFKGNPNGSEVIPGNVKNNKIILTPDQQNKVGGITLKNKIGLGEDFTWKGKVGFGDKEMINSDGNNGNTNNADGISFIFHTDDPGALGANGANVGAGGLPNVLGIKLDTYRNNAQEPNWSSKNLNEQLGWEADKPGVGKPGFGAIIRTEYTNQKGIPGWRVKQDYNSYQDLPYRPKKWYWGKNDYYPLDEGDMVINYNSSADGTLIFRYKDNVWEIPGVKKYYNDKGINSVSFSIQSSTGAFSSENAIKFESFVYKAVKGEVVINSAKKVYDKQRPNFTSAEINIFNEKGEKQKVDFVFQNSDFDFYSKEGQKIDAPVNVGEYIVKLSDSGKKRIVDQNLGYLGKLDVPKGEYRITPRNITVKADDITVNKGDTPSYSYQITGDGLVNGDKLEVQLASEQKTDRSGFFEGTIIPTIKNGNTNYKISLENGNLTV